MSKPDDLAQRAKAEVSAMAKQGLAHPSTKPVLTGAAIGAVAGLVLPIATLPLGLVAGAGYAFWTRIRRQMRCPYCAHEDSQVKDSRPTEDGAAIRRRRQCEGCGARFTTFERIQLRDIAVAKSNGTSEPFDRDKLARSIDIACRKRAIDPVRIERLVSGIQRQLETSGETEVPASRIGELAMEGLKGLDSVAYIRFASVYRDFTEAKDFESFAGSIREVGGE